MKNLFILFIISVFFGTGIQAQKAGFLGKKAIIHIDFKYRPATFDYHPYDDPNENLLGKINGALYPRMGASLEYVLSRWQSVEAGYSFHRCSAFGNFFNAANHEINISYRKYKITKNGGSIAPLGFYAKPTLILSYSKYSRSKGSGTGLLSEGQNFIHYGGGIEFGRQSVFFKKVLVTIAGGVSWIHYTGKEAKYFRDEYEEKANLGKLMIESPYGTILSGKLLEFKVGISIPTF